MKYYLIAGEASGDLHGSNLMKELKSIDNEAKFRFFGGDLMKAVGGELVVHYREMAFMGIINVLLNINTIKKNMEFCKKDLPEFHPDVLILIDYPGFNLRIAEFAKNNNIKVFYYIAPKVWAWKEHRIKKIKAFVDELFTILPFETQFFKKHEVDVNYVGNPLLDSLESFKKSAKNKERFLAENNLDERPIVAFLAGSRNQEIRNTLPVMVNASNGNPGFQFVVAGISSIDKNVYKKILGESKIRIIYNQTYDLLNNSFAALVASGTASLETALFKVPQLVLYRVEGGRFVHIIMKKLIKIKWASLPNLILDKEAIREYIHVHLNIFANWGTF